MAVCGKPCEVFSRIVGYYRPIQQWNNGKKEEFRLRTNFKGDTEELDWKSKKCRSCNIRMKSKIELCPECGFDKFWEIKEMFIE